MKKLTIIILVVSLYAQNEKFNINIANQQQLETLPLSSYQIEAIEEYLFNRGSISTIYDLLVLPEITSTDIQRLKPLITVDIPSISDFLENQKKSNYKVQWWLSAEGNTEGLSEVWLDKFYEPQDVNTMTRDELSALPNLSPIDVAAVLKQQQRGPIKGTFELKNAPGISYYGYKNLRDFIKYSNNNEDKPELHLRWSHLVRTVPITTNPDDEGTITEFSDPSNPEVFTKISTTYGDNFKTGFTYHRYMGEPQLSYGEMFNKGKKFIYIDDIFLRSRNQLKENSSLLVLDNNSGDYKPLTKPKFSIVVGNYTAAFGQGVVFETGDYFSPRRTGFQFTKRSDGIMPDLTRSTQYVLNGLAAQMTTNKFRGVFFVSKAPRDAIINGDGTDSTAASFTSLIVMQPRLPFGAYGDTTRIFEKLTNSVTEVTWGGNIRYSPTADGHIGFTIYESLYDRYLLPDVIGTITGGADDSDPELNEDTDYDNYSGDAYYLSYMTNSADPEIAAMYSNVGNSTLWDKAKSFRRVVGFDFSWVFENIVFQGEMGRFFNINKNLLEFYSEPNAMVLNAYTQFDNFNLLVLFRDYDLEFDNPYQRSFSNYQRYKTSILEDTYWLEDPIYSYLYSGNPQPQAEKGLFISSRYQFHRSFVGYLNWDNWTRKADDAHYYRTVVTMDWRPVFNYRINIRQKWQERGQFDIMHPSPFDSRETRIRVRLRLSKFNQLELLYVNSYTSFSPRPRLTDNGIVGGEISVGDINKPEESIGFSFNHNFDDTFKLKGGVLSLNGFVWYFEDTDFRLFNSDAGAMHLWISTFYRLGNNLSLQMKFTNTIENPFTRIVEGQTDQGYWINNPLVQKQNTDFRIQIDYAL